jgi:excisionase family DNA binding protein
MENRTLYSAEQVAELLGLHVRTVRNYVRDGRLKAVRIGKQYRIAREDLEVLTGHPVAVAGESATRVQHVEVSSIVQIDEIGPDAASRLSVLLTAGANVPRHAPGPLRIQTIHDEERARMKIVILGGVADTAELLHLLDGVLGPENGMFLSGSGSGSGEVRGG